MTATAANGGPKRANGSAHRSKTEIPRETEERFHLDAPACQLQDTEEIRDFEAALSGTIASNKAAAVPDTFRLVKGRPVWRDVCELDPIERPRIIAFKKATKRADGISAQDG